MSRIQLALNVSDLDASIAFYSELFGVAPHKRRPGYANFRVEDPPLKLVLIEVPGDERGAGTAGALNHLGIEVFSSEEVGAHATHLEGAGLTTRAEVNTLCCYAVQDKVWVDDPAGVPWEVYVVTDDDPAVLVTVPDDGACCAPAPDTP
ncbi:MAG: ArsI/CadI family heavy metal resistance metalloenzyme [Candidatus Nanopelagicales bacterium]